MIKWTPWSKVLLFVCSVVLCFVLLLLLLLLMENKKISKVLNNIAERNKEERKKKKKSRIKVNSSEVKSLLFQNGRIQHTWPPRLLVEKWKWKSSAVSDSLWPLDSSPPGSSVHGILQARILVWAVIPFSRGSSRRRDHTQVSCIAGSFFTIWATEKLVIGWSLQTVVYIKSSVYVSTQKQ